jgi:hypothetical protein
MSKRSRESGSSIAKDIRTTVEDDTKADIEKRTKYIKYERNLAEL